MTCGRLVTDEERLAYPIPLPWALRWAARPAIERVVELAWVFMTSGLDPRLGMIAALESFIAEKQPSWMRTFQGVFREAVEELATYREEYQERARVLRERHPETFGDVACDACVIVDYAGEYRAGAMDEKAGYEEMLADIEKAVHAWEWHCADDPDPAKDPGIGAHTALRELESMATSTIGWLLKQLRERDKQLALAKLTAAGTLDGQEQTNKAHESAHDLLKEVGQEVDEALRVAKEEELADRLQDAIGGARFEARRMAMALSRQPTAT